MSSSTMMVPTNPQNSYCLPNRSRRYAWGYRGGDARTTPLFGEERFDDRQLERPKSLLPWSTNTRGKASAER
jgi:hypothetical protein